MEPHNENLKTALRATFTGEQAVPKCHRCGKDCQEMESDAFVSGGELNNLKVYGCLDCNFAIVMNDFPKCPSCGAQWIKEVSIVKLCLGGHPRECKVCQEWTSDATMAAYNPDLKPK